MNIKHKTGKTSEFSYTLYWAEFCKKKKKNLDKTMQFQLFDLFKRNSSIHIEVRGKCVFNDRQ